MYICILKKKKKLNYGAQYWLTIDFHSQLPDLIINEKYKKYAYLGQLKVKNGVAFSTNYDKIEPKNPNSR